MKRIIAIIIIATGLVVMTFSAQAQNKREEKKAKQIEAYNKAAKAIENQNFIFVNDDVNVNKRESFILIKGGKGTFQAYPGITGMRPISDITITKKKNGDIRFRCELAYYESSKTIMYITLRHDGNTAVANFMAHDMIGKIYPENEVDYLLYRNMRYNE